VGRERSEVADHFADNGGDSTSANGTFLTCNVPGGTAASKGRADVRADEFRS